MLRAFKVFDLLLRSGDRESFLVKKFSNSQDEVEVLSPVEALEGPSLVGFDGFEFRFPVTEHMGFDPRDPAHLSNPVVEPFLGDGIFQFSISQQSGYHIITSYG